MAMALPPPCDPAKDPVFAADGDRFDSVPGSVVIQFQMAILKVWTGLWHPARSIADGLGQWRFARDFGQLCAQPGLQIINDGSDPACRTATRFSGDLRRASVSTA